jgi:regulation of enolase protein 1 (concanavalin A-like superfamily)
MTTFVLPGLPAPLAWYIEPPKWRIESDGSLTILAGPDTDYFHDPSTGKRTASAPCALMTIEEPSFILSTRASMIASETFDAAVLFIRVSDDIWAKLCLENSPAGKPTIVSVVTRDLSDDCNSVTLARSDVWLRVAKAPNTVAFHYSLDARYWHLVRYFSLGFLDTVQVGFVAQSPLGRGSQARFSDFAYRSGELGNLRDGQ